MLYLHYSFPGPVGPPGFVGDIGEEGPEGFSYGGDPGMTNFQVQWEWTKEQESKWGVFFIKYGEWSNRAKECAHRFLKQYSAWPSSGPSDKIKYTEKNPKN